ncbi:MAG: hypothetical protein V1717_03495 [Candidatus Micrarchaeota archaeon]
MRFRLKLTNNQAALLVLALVSLQLVFIAGIANVFPRPVSTSLASGQVLSVVENELPLNYYFNATAANEEYLGTPAYRLSFGQDVILEGSEADENGYSDVTSSICDWTAAGYASSTSVSFTTCNATYCNYTCALTLSESTATGVYNVNSRIIDNADEESSLNATIYVFGFTVPPSALFQGGSLSGDILILRPVPAATPVPAAEATPTPSLGPEGPLEIIEEFQDYDLRLIVPSFIDKCSVVDAVAVVENKNPQYKEVTLDFEGKRVELKLLPLESKSIYFKIKAPESDGEQTFLVSAFLFESGRKVAEKQKKLELSWKGTDFCITVSPAQEYSAIAGKTSVARAMVEIGTDLDSATLELEADRNEKSAFLDLVDLKGHYYKTSFLVFERGSYQATARVRNGFQTVDEKVEKFEIG